MLFVEILMSQMSASRRVARIPPGKSYAMKKRNPHGDDIHYFKASHVSGYSGYRRNKSIDVDVDQFQKAVGVNPFMRPPSHVTRTLARGNVWRQRFNEAGDGKQLT